MGLKFDRQQKRDLRSQPAHSPVPTPKVGLAPRIFKVGLVLHHQTNVIAAVSTWPLVWITGYCNRLVMYINQSLCESRSGIVDVMLPQPGIYEDMFGLVGLTCS